VKEQPSYLLHLERLFSHACDAWLAFSAAEFLEQEATLPKTGYRTPCKTQQSIGMPKIGDVIAHLTFLKLEASSDSSASISMVENSSSLPTMDQGSRYNRQKTMYLRDSRARRVTVLP
jgi:hypothetical protein